MSNEFEEDTHLAATQETQDACKKSHIEDLDEQVRICMSVFTTIRSKIEDLARAESDIKRFELSIEADRERLQKTFDAAKLGLRNARIQIAVELQKIDGVGFTKVADLIKEASRA